MSYEIAKTPVDPTQFPEAAHKFAQRALREHQRAEKNVMRAVEHIVKSGQALLKAYDLCEHGQWVGFFEMHFGEKTTRDDGTRPLTLRTAQKYMQLARDWSRLIAEHPAGFSSQRQAFKALAALVQGDEPKRIRAIGAARGANATSGHGKDAARGANGGKPARTGPVWRASGPFVKEALRIMNSADETLTKLVSRGYPLAPEAKKVHEGLERLQAMLEREIDEAEALQAAGDWTFVAESDVEGVSRASTGQAERLHHNVESGPTALTPALSQSQREKEDDHDN
jgi:hypothetical protein